MSNIIKLLTVSVLLSSCTNMHGNSTNQVLKNHKAVNHATQHVSDHVNTVNNISATNTSNITKTYDTYQKTQ